MTRCCWSARCGCLVRRAAVTRWLGEAKPAVAAGEEPLGVAGRNPGAQGFTLSGRRFSRGDILREAGRAAEAAPLYQAILDDPDAISWDQRVAHQGLAQCALAAGDRGTARREARAAGLLAGSLRGSGQRRGGKGGPPRGGAKA